MATEAGFFPFYEKTDFLKIASKKPQLLPALKRSAEKRKGMIKTVHRGSTFLSSSAGDGAEISPSVWCCS